MPTLLFRAAPAPPDGPPAAGPRRGADLRSGAVLIVSLAVLVVLALLATVFATMAQVERDISRNYVDHVRARMLAESGVQEALAELNRLIVRTTSEDRDRDGVLDPGEDVNGNGVLNSIVAPGTQDVVNGVPWPAATTWWNHGEDLNRNNLLDPGEDQDGDGRLDVATCPAADARRPSLADYAPGGNPRTVFLDLGTGPAKPRGVTRALTAGSYGRNSDIHTVRILDTSAQIYVNDVNPNLRRILNNIGRYVVPPVPNLGDRILAGRAALPYHAWRAKRELVQRGILTAAEFERVDEFLTVHAWVDDRVANPVPLSATEHNRSGGPYLIREGIGEERYFRPDLRPGGIFTTTQKGYRYGPHFSTNYSNITGPMTGGGHPIPRRTQHVFARGRNINSPVDTPSGSFIYGVDELHPQWIETSSRAPVNLNTAPREVLTALLEGLDGFYWTERPRQLMETSGYQPWAQTQHVFGLVPGAGANMSSRWIDFVRGFTRNQSADRNGSNLGVLYRTGPFLGPAGTSAGGRTGRLAAEIADRILRYRSGENLFPGASGLPDLREGPFASWAEFNEFCDQLVLQDNGIRNLLLNVQEGSPFAWGGGDVERFVHAQAKIDVLKANFNPNLHLNELNPDAALWTWVDKTDLVVASTEFCFQPMGIFEIESCGRVVQPAVGGVIRVGEDLFAPGRTGEVVAEKVVRTIVKIYDAIRDTNQKDFFGGETGTTAWSTAPGWRETGVGPLPAPGFPTNNGLPLQTGPEPDNGDAPFDNEYEGYVSLSPLGGLRTPNNVNVPKAKRRVWTNLPQTVNAPSIVPPARATEDEGGAPESPQCWFHAHFDFDFNAHFSNTQDFNFYWSGGPPWRGERRTHFARRHDRALNSGINRVYLLALQWYNYPAPSETHPGGVGNPNDSRHIRGPYCVADRYDGAIRPVYASPGLNWPGREYRCGRSFRVDRVWPAGSAYAPGYVPSPSQPGVPWHRYAPSNLRMDGGYFERHTAPLWSPTNDWEPTAVHGGGAWIHAPINVFQGAVGYWIKPNFQPEIAGKNRVYFSISRPHGGGPTDGGDTREGGWHHLNPSPFAHYFVTNHYPPARLGATAPMPYFPGLLWSSGMQTPGSVRRPFIFGYGFGGGSGYDGTRSPYQRDPDPPGPRDVCRAKIVGAFSESMNRLTARAPTDYLAERYRTRIETYPTAVGAPGRPWVDGHQWTHVLLVWRMRSRNNNIDLSNDPSRGALLIYVNGQIRHSDVSRDPYTTENGFPADPRRIDEGNPYGYPGTIDDPAPGPVGPNDKLSLQAWHSYSWFWDPSQGEPSHSTSEGAPAAARRLIYGPGVTPGGNPFVSPIRLGEPTNVVPSRDHGQNTTRNFSADTTFDEFFIWGEANYGIQGGRQQWREGRYYRQNNGFFISRHRPVTPPEVARRPAPAQGMTASPSFARRRQEILGVAWTIATRGYAGHLPVVPSLPGLGRHRVMIHNAYLPAGPVLSLSTTGGAPYYGVAAGTSLSDYRWSVPWQDFRRTRLLQVPVVPPGAAMPAGVRYRAAFQITGLNPASSILLESPFLDDVTTFCSVGAPIFLEWIEL